MQTYLGDKKFEAAAEGAQFSIRLRSAEPMSFEDYGEILQDLDTIFDVCSREFTGRRVGNNKKVDAKLVVADLKAGSLELVADPYFAGVITGVVANGIYESFKYTLRRLGGKPKEGQKSEPPQIDPKVITSDRLKDALNKSVERSNNQRRRFRNRTRTFGLKIEISMNGQFEDLTE